MVDIMAVLRPSSDNQDPYVPFWREAEITLTLPQVQTLVAAMAGEFPEALSEHRWEVLTKLAKAKAQIELGMRSDG